MARLTRSQLADALGLAVQRNAAYIAKAAPSTAENTAQLKALTRQMNHVLRLVAAALPDAGVEDD